MKVSTQAVKSGAIQSNSLYPAAKGKSAKKRAVPAVLTETGDPAEAADEVQGNAAKMIYSILKNEIIRLNIKPGQQVSESDVCRRFNVSRTPVRMAFQRLKDAGLLSIIPYKNTTASLLSFRQVEQAIYLRIAVESMVIRDMIAVMDAVVEEKIRHALRLQEILLSGKCSPGEFFQSDSGLHRMWFCFAGKDGLWKTIQRLSIHYKRFRMLDYGMLDYGTGQNVRLIFEEHRELFRIIQARDAGMVEDFMHRHLYGGIKRIGDRVSTEFSSYFIDKSENLDIKGGLN
jgi:DNA-binding GntR family transcriptional regulator